MDNFLQKLPSFVRIWLFEYIKKFATIQGRATRAQYWYSALCVFIVNAVLGILGIIPFVGVLFDIISFVFGLACIVPNITLTARRLHDVGLSALWIVWYILALVVITVLGLIFTGIAAGAGLPGFAYLGIGILVIGYIASSVVWLVFMVKPSNEGANKFGEPAEIKELSSFSIKAE